MGWLSTLKNDLLKISQAGRNVKTMSLLRRLIIFLQFGCIRSIFRCSVKDFLIKYDNFAAG